MTTSDAGLCEDCRHVRLVETHRGSVFYRCGAADTDPRLARYPRLPVRSCPAYSPAGEGGGAPPAGG